MIHPTPGHHPVFGKLEQGQVIEVSDSFNISGGLFERVREYQPFKKKKREVKDGNW